MDSKHSDTSRGGDGSFEVESASDVVDRLLEAQSDDDDDDDDEEEDEEEEIKATLPSSSNNSAKDKVQDNLNDAIDLDGEETGERLPVGASTEQMTSQKSDEGSIKPKPGQTKFILDQPIVRQPTRLNTPNTVVGMTSEKDKMLKRFAEEQVLKAKSMAVRGLSTSSLRHPVPEIRGGQIQRSSASIVRGGTFPSNRFMKGQPVGRAIVGNQPNRGVNSYHPVRGGVGASGSGSNRLQAGFSRVGIPLGRGGVSPMAGRGTVSRGAILPNRGGRVLQPGRDLEDFVNRQIQKVRKV